MILSSLSRVMSNICTESYHFQEDWLRDHVLQTGLKLRTKIRTETLDLEALPRS